MSLQLNQCVEVCMLVRVQVTNLDSGGIVASQAIDAGGLRCMRLVMGPGRRSPTNRRGRSDYPLACAWHLLLGLVSRGVEVACCYCLSDATNSEDEAGVQRDIRTCIQVSVQVECPKIRHLRQEA